MCKCAVGRWWEKVRIGYPHGGLGDYVAPVVPTLHLHVVKNGMNVVERGHKGHKKVEVGQEGI